MQLVWFARYLVVASRVVLPGGLPDTDWWDETWLDCRVYCLALRWRRCCEGQAGHSESWKTALEGRRDRDCHRHLTECSGFGLEPAVLGRAPLGGDAGQHDKHQGDGRGAKLTTHSLHAGGGQISQAEQVLVLILHGTCPWMKISWS